MTSDIIKKMTEDGLSTNEIVKALKDKIDCEALKERLLFFYVQRTVNNINNGKTNGTFTIKPDSEDL
jgi:hypothetical protein